VKLALFSSLTVCVFNLEKDNIFKCLCDISEFTSSLSVRASFCVFCTASSRSMSQCYGVKVSHAVQQRNLWSVGILSIEHNKPSPSESMSRSGFWRYSHRSRSHCSDEAPTPGEVRHSICKLRNRCAVGSDGILPELLKYTEEPGSISLQSLCVLQLSY